MAFAYGVLCYCGFLGVFAYLIAFISGSGLERTVDGPVTSATGEALWIDGLLLGLFGVQHSVMARRGFKRWITRFIPPSVERSTYVLVTVGILFLLFWQWRPIDTLVWDVESPVLRVLCQSLLVCGWVLVLVATALINHADLFGLRQVWCRLRGRRYFSPGFVTPGPYQVIRHPLYLGWILSFWATPRMTAGHLLFAGFMTVYVLIAVRFEERDLLFEHGRRYHRYQKRTPMLVPFVRQPGRGTPRSAGAGSDS